MFISNIYINILRFFNIDRNSLIKSYTEFTKIIKIEQIRSKI